MKIPNQAALRIENVAISQIRPDPRNPRRHSERQIKQVCRSIQQFGFLVPILIDREGRLIAGHARHAAATRMGRTEVPVIRLEHLSEPQLRAFAIADNKLVENATWDDRLLGEIFVELGNLNLDPEITGFSAAEIDLRIEGLSANDDGNDAADQLPAPSETVVSRPGDLWQLGPHAVLCGNALDKPCWDHLMKAERAAMVFTDPPYNVHNHGHVSGLGRIRHREFAMAAGELSKTEFVGFLTTVAKMADSLLCRWIHTLYLHGLAPPAGVA